MSEGFVVDTTHGGAAVSNWVEGQPRKNNWTGLSLTGLARSEIRTWRCNRCGFLEHYAAAAPDNKQEAAQRSQVLLVLAITSALLLLAVIGALLLR